VANNTDGGTTTNKTVGFPNGRALVIGVANYAGVSALPSAILNDASDVASVLVSASHCGYEPSKVKVLLDSTATLSSIRNALKELTQTSQVDDTVVIFFSGHGARFDTATGPTTGLVPVDCDMASLATSVLPEDEFSAALQSIKARRLVVLLDACHSGGAGSFKSIDNSALGSGFDEKALSRLAQGTGRVLMASSRATETSLVFHGARNSLFTQHVLQALRGEGKKQGDGLIRVFDLFTHVSETVKVVAAAEGESQHPIFKASDLENNFAIALDHGGVKNAMPNLAASVGLSSNATIDVWVQLQEILPELYPIGPVDQEVWTRAGGDVSRLRLTGAGRANWFSALRVLKQGGGGMNIGVRSLVEVALDDYQNHPGLSALLTQLPS
jgi:hypothetical protein